MMRASDLDSVFDRKTAPPKTKPPISPAYTKLDLTTRLFSAIRTSATLFDIPETCSTGVFIYSSKRCPRTASSLAPWISSVNDLKSRVWCGSGALLGKSDKFRCSRLPLLWMMFRACRGQIVLARVERRLCEDCEKVEDRNPMNTRLILYEHAMLLLKVNAHIWSIRCTRIEDFG